MADLQPLEAALNEAYRTWSQTGHATVAGFSPADYDRADLEARLADLEAIGRRCIICSTKAAWLRREIA